MTKISRLHELKLGEKPARIRTSKFPYAPEKQVLGISFSSESRQGWVFNHAFLVISVINLAISSTVKFSFFSLSHPAISSKKKDVLTCASTFEDVIKFDTSVEKPGQRQLFASSPWKAKIKIKSTCIHSTYMGMSA